MTNLNLSFAQAFSSNWFMGEENFFALKLSTRGNYQHPIGPFLLKNTFSIAIGANYVEDTTSLAPVRATDNDLFGEAVIVYPLSWRIDPYFSGSVRTPITESFMHFGNNRTRMSSLWDPVTSQQGAGFTYSVYGRSGMFNTRIGLSLQQIRAESNTMLSDDPLTFKVKEAYNARSGIEFVNEAMFRGDSTVTYTGRFGMFGSFKEPDVWSVRWENETRFRLWKSIALTWTLNVIHDVRQTRRTQFKQSIMLGLIQDL